MWISSTPSHLQVHVKLAQHLVHFRGQVLRIPVGSCTLMVLDGSGWSWTFWFRKQTDMGRLCGSLQVGSTVKNVISFPTVYVCVVKITCLCDSRPTPVWKEHRQARSKSISQFQAQTRVEALPKEALCKHPGRTNWSPLNSCTLFPHQVFTDELLMTARG